MHVDKEVAAGKTEDVAIAQYHSLRPFDFHELVRLEIQQSRNTGAIDTAIMDTASEVELSTTDECDMRRLILNFSGVRSFKYIPSSSVLSFSFIEIVSIHQNQWEGINYQVFHSEQDTDFAFYCREFSAHVVT